MAAAEETQASEDAHGVHQHDLEVAAAVDAPLLAGGVHPLVEGGHPQEAEEEEGREVHDGPHLEDPHEDHQDAPGAQDGGPQQVDLLQDVRHLVEEGSIPAHRLHLHLRVNEFSENGFVFMMINY